MEILTAGSPQLRVKAKSVRRVDDATRKILDQMVRAVVGSRAVGLAAPQIGIPLRIIFITKDDAVLPIINPEVVKMSEEKVKHAEGCLSLPGQTWITERPKSVVVRGRNYKGHKVRFALEDRDAAVVMHEMDHLDGKLLSDVPEDSATARGGEKREE